MKFMLKCPRNQNYESKKIQILGENEINSRLKQGKAHDSILSSKFGVVSERLPDNLRELACMG